MTELEVAAILGAEGPFAREVPGFAPREAQQRMASAVAGAIAERDVLIAEAGTGTGKTFAYLVPALMSGRKVIVSTGTKALQDQLFFRDLPRVHAVLGSRARVSLLKGRANYLCLYRLDQAVREEIPTVSWSPSCPRSAHGRHGLVVAIAWKWSTSPRIRRSGRG